MTKDDHFHGVLLLVESGIVFTILGSLAKEASHFISVPQVAGGVAGLIRVATFETPAGGVLAVRMLTSDEISEHQQALESAGEALRTWRDQLQSGAAANNAPDQPEAPQVA